LAYEHVSTRAVGIRPVTDRLRAGRPPRGSITVWMQFIAIAAMVAVSACQELDPNLASGSGSGETEVGGARPGATAVSVSPRTGAGGDMPGRSSDGGPPETAAAPCTTARAEARAILDTQCGYCHQAPDNARSVYATGQFNFILELDKITTLKSIVFSMSYVAAGSPNASLIYQRTSNGTMPPLNIPQRPSAGDLAVLNRWITSCVDGSSTGWPAPRTTGLPDDAGRGDDGEVVTACGVPGQRCCSANVCNGGGCCVGGLCRANGLTCAAPPAELGAPAMVGLAGTCKDGSCETAAGAACGKPSEPCCDLMTCTGAQSACFPGTTTCAACGDTGQSCCRPNACLDGRACINGGVGRIGTCQLCGAKGQACCGTGTVAMQTCDVGLTCGPVAGMGNLCSATGTGAVAP
jgi:hypothetical protein